MRYASDLLETGAGACGYLLKERVAHPDILEDALRRVSEGQCVLDPAVVTQLMNRNRVRGPLDDLTAREREILDLMAQGHSNARIGDPARPQPADRRVARAQPVRAPRTRGLPRQQPSSAGGADLHQGLTPPACAHAAG